MRPMIRRSVASFFLRLLGFTAWDIDGVPLGRAPAVMDNDD